MWFYFLIELVTRLDSGSTKGRVNAPPGERKRKMAGESPVRKKKKQK
ncbi:uncharacterized protein G2W53_018288 [Senna tora]|uniref:Uncharacterized protein n=1 Tax=Senna tora TaxID=362788 RepID=A0A834TSQ9_9FABA|nr:uncharacterized protein G2W53_018288 [Senna tora]